MGKDTTLGEPRQSVGHHNGTTGCEFAREVRSTRVISFIEKYFFVP